MVRQSNRLALRLYNNRGGYVRECCETARWGWSVLLVVIPDPVGNSIFQVPDMIS